MNKKQWGAIVRKINNNLTQTQDKSFCKGFIVGMRQPHRLTLEQYEDLDRIINNFKMGF